jgi:type I restriction enzyme M protein
MNHFREKADFIWRLAELLRGPYKPHQYGDVILPLTVLRRLDCVLEPAREKVLAKLDTLKGKSDEEIEKILCRQFKLPVINTSGFNFEKLRGDPNHLAANLTRYIKKFSKKAREILEKFAFEEHIARLEEANRLYLIVGEFAKMDLHPDEVPNTEMGYIFEELIRRFSEAKNEEAGHHFTPREVIRLMVNLIFSPDGRALTQKGYAPTLYDPACGTGGMLSVSEEYIRELNPDARPQLFGQDFNPEAFAICGSDMLIKGQSIDNVKFGDTLGDGKTSDGFPGMKFDYMLSNPPFGVEWKPEEDAVRKEHEVLGHAGRFGAGLPRISDGSFLFLQNMLSKTKPEAAGGSRLAIVFNGSPLFTGDAGSGESNIRRWIIENDWLEAVVALPDQLFYNTGIFTYLWVLTNRKARNRRGKVQLINAVHFFQKMRKSLGQKRNEIGDGTDGKPDHIREITNIHGDCRHDDARTLTIDGQQKRVIVSKVFDNSEFGYRKITIERPLRLAFQVLPERISKLRDATSFMNLAKSKYSGKKGEAEEAAGRERQAAIVALLESFGFDRVWDDRKEFRRELDAAADERGVKLSRALRNAIENAIGKRDEQAAICVDDEGNTEPDPDLRDYENVPLNEDVFAYFDREVQPHVPDAWLNTQVRDEQDGKVGKVGYEIPLTRHFYVYHPPRPLEQIEADIAALETDIVKMLREVVG